MDLSVCIQSLTTLVPTLVTAGQSVIEIVRTSIKGAGYEFSKELEERIIELEKNKNTDGIIALLKDFEKNCNNTTITQTSHGQGAINVGSGNVTVTQTFNQGTASQRTAELSDFSGEAKRLLAEAGKTGDSIFFIDYFMDAIKISPVHKGGYNIEPFERNDFNIIKKRLERFNLAEFSKDKFELTDEGIEMARKLSENKGE